jgi:hypothetical protein
MSLSSEGIIAIVVAGGALLVIILASIIFWCLCCRTAAASQKVRGGGGHGVPLQIVSSPPEGTYAVPLTVELKTVQPNLDILVRIVAVGADGCEVDDELGGVAMINGGGGVGSSNALFPPAAPGDKGQFGGVGGRSSFPAAIDGHNAVAGLMLYRDALEFTEPGTYYVLAHTLSPDKAVSEVHQFNFTLVGDESDIPRGATAVMLGIEPPMIEPCRGEVTRSSAITISHPLHSTEAPIDHIGGHTDAVRALIEQSDVALWYSVDGSFPRTRYFGPFCLPLPPHQTQHRVTVRALSTSMSRGVASDVVEANLTVVTDRYHFFDPSVVAPTLQLNASGSMLYFEDPKPLHLFGDSGGSKSGGGSHYAAGASSGGVYQVPPLAKSNNFDGHLNNNGSAGAQRYDLAGGTWRVMYCMESVDAARHQSQTSGSHVFIDAAVSVSAGGKQQQQHGSYWCEYSTPVAVPRDVARIAAFTTCSITNRTFRSAVVFYDVSLQHYNMLGGGGGGDLPIPNHFHHQDSESNKKKHGGSGSAKKSKKDSHSKPSKKSADGQPSTHWEAKVLHYDNTMHRAVNDPPQATASSSAGLRHHGGHDFPPPPLSSYVEDTSLIPSPVMCITCSDVEVAFDDPPRGGMILYTINDTDPVADLDAETPNALEYRVGSAPIKLLRGEYDQVALTARIVFPIEQANGGGGSRGGAGSSVASSHNNRMGGGGGGAYQSYRYGHRFSRHFYVQ